MNLRRTDPFVMLVLTTLAAIFPATSVAWAVVASREKDYEDSSVNEVDKKSKPAVDPGEHEAAEVDNRIPIIFSEVSDLERVLSSDGTAVTGSGELKLTSEHPHPTFSAARETGVKIAPKYMLDLYDKFSNDKYSHPMANIVRSFTNIHTGRPLITIYKPETSNITIQTFVVCLFL